MYLPVVVVVKFCITIFNNFYFIKSYGTLTFGLINPFKKNKKKKKVKRAPLKNTMKKESYKNTKVYVTYGKCRF